jgi:hypothetical protein
MIFFKERLNMRIKIGIDIFNCVGSFSSIMGVILTVLASQNMIGVEWGIGGFYVIIITIVLIFIANLLMIINPLVEYHTDFRKYCVLCAKMARKARQFIFTIQTPATTNSMKAQDIGNHYFKKYLRVTAKKILKTKLNGESVLHSYCRLIVVDRSTIEDEQNKVDFFLKSIQEELSRFFSSRWYCLLRFLHLGGKVIPSLQVVEIGVVHADVVSQCFFSNLDIHITGVNSYVIAFQKKGVNNSGLPETYWQGSLHTNDVRGDELRHCINSLYTDIWPTTEVGTDKNGRKISLFEYFKNLSFDNWETTLGNCIDNLRNNVNFAINEVGNAVA